MIRISQIDDNFTIYKENTVVLLGIGQGTKQIFDLFAHYNINIDYICDNNKENYGKLLGVIPVISPQHLLHLQQKENVVVQISNASINNDIESQLNSIGINNVISFYEAWNIFEYFNKFNYVNKFPQILKYENLHLKNLVLDDKIRFFDHLYKLLDNDLIFLCLPPKTGDHTLINTLNANKINFYRTIHRPHIFEKEIFSNINNKIKIITAIRDPISKDLSELYQELGIDKNLNAFFWRLAQKDLYKDGGDVQKLFNLRFDNVDKDTDSPINFLTTKTFMKNFKENILDLSKYPFDQEKGYTIIKDDNIEVFVYQLEKMNDIVKEMSDWIGQTPFDKWVVGNEASGKWIAKSYKQAQKEITFSQEYFDKCYNDPCVQHFYSQEDIEKFKARWRPHIKD